MMSVYVCVKPTHNMSATAKSRFDTSGDTHSEGSIVPDVQYPRNERYEEVDDREGCMMTAIMVKLRHDEHLRLC